MKKLMVPFLIGGYPIMEVTREIMLDSNDLDLDYIGVQIPYVDAQDQQEVNSKASETAIKSGVNVDLLFEMFKDISQQVTAKLIVSCDYQSLRSYGVEQFCQQANRSQVYGLVVPNLPPLYSEEGEWIQSLVAAAKCHKIILIPAVTPDGCDEAYLRLATEDNQGLIYCTLRADENALSQAETQAKLTAFLQNIRTISQLPVIAEGAIANQDHIRAICRIFDGVFVSSKITKITEQSYDRIPLQPGMDREHAKFVAFEVIKNMEMLFLY